MRGACHLLTYFDFGVLGKGQHDFLGIADYVTVVGLGLHCCSIYYIASVHFRLGHLEKQNREMYFNHATDDARHAKVLEAKQYSSVEFTRCNMIMRKQRERRVGTANKQGSACRQGKD